MKYDISKNPLWQCYCGVLPDWYGDCADTNVGTIIDEMLDAIQEEFGLNSDEDCERIMEVVSDSVHELGSAFIKDIKEIAETGAGDVIDEVMDKKLSHVRGKSITTPY